jgi:hypothetical protein
MRHLALLLPLSLAACVRAPSAWVSPEPNAPEAPAAFDGASGDGIAIAAFEHHGRANVHMQPRYEITADRIRTAPSWGVRTKSRLMHDGRSLTLGEAILRHGGEAADARERFQDLSAREKEQLLLTFPRSL